MCRSSQTTPKWRYFLAPRQGYRYFVSCRLKSAETFVAVKRYAYRTGTVRLQDLAGKNRERLIVGGHVGSAAKLALPSLMIRRKSALAPANQVLLGGGIVMRAIANYRFEVTHAV